MSDSQIIGQTGEDLAASYLKKNGYTIRHRNWKFGKHELDIIAENREFVVFAEVKTRSSGFLMDPRSAVTKEKQRSIIFAAEGYIRIYDINKDSRFDVITVISDGDNHELDHIENAFYPTLR